MKRSRVNPGYLCFMFFLTFPLTSENIEGYWFIKVNIRKKRKKLLIHKINIIQSGWERTCNHIKLVNPSNLGIIVPLKKKAVLAMLSQ